MTRKFLFLIGLLILAIHANVFAEPVRFIVFGDSQGGSQGINELVLTDITSQVMELEPAAEFVLVVGDLIQGENAEEQAADDFALWRQIAAPFYEADFFGAKVYPTLGNHDVHGVGWEDRWRNAFPELPDNGPDNAKKMSYSFDVGQCHFVAILTNMKGELEHEVDLEWLEADLADNDKPMIFVYGHEPAYPLGLHIGESLDAKPEKRDAFWQLLVEYGVSVYFCGHEHVYDHWMKDGVHQIITGGGGGLGPFFHFLIIDVNEDGSDATIHVHDVTENDNYKTYKLSETDNVNDHERVDGWPSLEWLFVNMPCVWMIMPIGLLFATSWKLTDDDI